MFASSPLNPWWWLLLPLQHSPKGQLAAFTSSAAAVRNISSVHLPPVFGRGEFEKFRGVHVHLHMVTCLLLEKEEEEDMWHHWKLWLWLWSVGEAAWPVEWHQKCKQTAHMATFSDAKSLETRYKWDLHYVKPGRYLWSQYLVYLGQKYWGAKHTLAL